MNSSCFKSAIMYFPSFPPILDEVNIQQLSINWCWVIVGLHHAFSCSNVVSLLLATVDTHDPLDYFLTNSYHLFESYYHQHIIWNNTYTMICTMFYHQLCMLYRTTLYNFRRIYWKWSKKNKNDPSNLLQKCSIKLFCKLKPLHFQTIDFRLPCYVTATMIGLFYHLASSSP